MLVRVGDFMESSLLRSMVRRYNSGNMSKEEVKKISDEYSSLEIWEAKLNLIKDEGINEAKVREFSRLLTESIEDESARIRSKLEEGHPIRQLLVHHEKIEALLDDLENFVYDQDADIGELKSLVRELSKINIHERWEDKLLFPRLKNKGLSSLVTLLEYRHSQIYGQVKELNEMMKNSVENKKEMNRIVDYLTYSLRDHYFKENNILYPKALEKIDDWDSLKKEAEVLESLNLEH